MKNVFLVLLLACVQSAFASDIRCAYTQRVTDQPVRKGMMLGVGCKECDYREAAKWGATLLRYQMSRQWDKVGGNADLADYARYVDRCLTELEEHLEWARKYGMRIVVDLHAPPGSRNQDKDLTMCHDPKYAEAFVATWQRIASRLKAHPAIYGYDLVNEPWQMKPAVPGCDFWSLQIRAARAIREIDSETPIIFEVNHAADPEGFVGLKPVDLVNVIYQVHMYSPHSYTHQGIGNASAPSVSYPDSAHGLDRSLLERELSPVRAFERRYGAKIYAGEFSAISWAPGAECYLADCIDLFSEYGWDWTYHAFREWEGWSVEFEPVGRDRFVPSLDNPRKRVLLNGLK